MLFQISRNAGAFNSIVTSLPQVSRGAHSATHHRLIQQRQIALSVGDYPKALAAFQQANQIQPNNVSVITGQGTALFRLDRKQAAIATLKAALALDPSYEPARTILNELISKANQ